MICAVPIVSRTIVSTCEMVDPTGMVSVTGLKLKTFEAPPIGWLSDRWRVIKSGDPVTGFWTVTCSNVICPTPVVFDVGLRFREGPVTLTWNESAPNPGAVDLRYAVPGPTKLIRTTPPKCRLSTTAVTVSAPAFTCAPLSIDTTVGLLDVTV